MSLAKTTTERNIKMNQVTNIRTQIEKEAREHQKVFKYLNNLIFS